MTQKIFLSKVRQVGFTLIELIIVIVLIGILAAVAIPKYTDLTRDAKSAKLDGLGGAIASASAINYVLVASDKGGSAVTQCSDALTLVSPAVAAASLVADTEATAGSGSAISCQLKDSGDATITSSTFSVIATANP